MSKKSTDPRVTKLDRKIADATIDGSKFLALNPRSVIVIERMGNNVRMHTAELQPRTGAIATS